MVDSGNKRVWITGVGLATPLGGTSFTDFGDRLMAGNSGIRAITSFDASTHSCRIGGFLEPLECPPAWSPEDFAAHTPWEQLLVACAVRALQDSGWWERRASSRIGIILGLGAEWGVTWVLDAHRGGKQCLDPQSNGEGYARFLRDGLNLSGPVSTVAAACASGNVALGMARQWIRHGWVDVVLAGACERPIAPVGLASFGNLGALSSRNDSPTTASRPFDKNRDGFVMAEGGALFVLESSQSARPRGAKVYGEIAGFGSTSDAFHIVAPSDDPSHAAAAMREAMRDARLNPDEIDYVNAHATSTPLGDVFETKALRLALGESVATIPVSGTKSMTGHMVGAASAVEAAVCLSAISRQTVPPTINLDEIDPECQLCHVPNQAQSRRVDVALSNSFGFGGSNTCLVVRRVA